VTCNVNCRFNSLGLTATDNYSFSKITVILQSKQVRQPLINQQTKAIET